MLGALPSSGLVEPPRASCLVATDVTLAALGWIAVDGVGVTEPELQIMVVRPPRPCPVARSKDGDEG